VQTRAQVRAAAQLRAVPQSPALLLTTCHCTAPLGCSGMPIPWLLLALFVFFIVNHFFLQGRKAVDAGGGGGGGGVAPS
jgi:hypothetical protein